MPRQMPGPRLSCRGSSTRFLHGVLGGHHRKRRDHVPARRGYGRFSGTPGTNNFERSGSQSMNFEHSQATRTWIAKVERFMEERIYPNEQTWHEQLASAADRW